MPKQSQSQMFDNIQAFRSARMQATLEQIWAALTGRSADLLSYEEVRKLVHARESGSRVLKEVPLDAIVGSVGRYTDFTRRFLPLKETDRQRWTRVRAQMEGMTGLPPVDLYQIGDVYFVRDGNHRVSIAREMENKTIEAYVTRVETKVPLTPDIKPDELIIKARYAHILSETKLDDLVPDLDMSMTIPGKYRILEEEIRIHQEWLAREKERELTFTEAAADWYHTRYLPVIHVIRHRGLMRDFWDRTETDVYVWLQEHREELRSTLGWSVDADNAAMDFVWRHSRLPSKALRRMWTQLRQKLVPTMLETGPAPGAWRQTWQENRADDRMFPHILVALNGRPDGYLALEQAISIAKREKAHIYGLHVVRYGGSVEDETAVVAREEFNRRCQEAGVGHQMSIAIGSVTSTICYRARWADLVVVNLAHPPGERGVERLSSQFSQLLRRCPRPVLAVPSAPAPLLRLLIAYDGSPRAREALYVAAYMGRSWQLSVVVLTVQTTEVAAEKLEEARRYLEQQSIQADYVNARGDTATEILNEARSRECDLLLVGGYAQDNPMLGLVAGSVVDQLLRTRKRPILVCR